MLLPDVLQMTVVRGLLGKTDGDAVDMHVHEVLKTLLLILIVIV